MVSFHRTHTCGELRESDIQKKVILTGWVHRHRDLGALIFIDLRDRFGITQIVVDPKAFPHVAEFHFEDVIAVEGVVQERKQKNPDLPTGNIELEPQAVTRISKSKVLPFSICDEEKEVNEELRLKYRYLDMRKSKLIENMVVRHKALQVTRQVFSEEEFLEVQTPVLGKSTPEGARDYLVPSRIHPASFYALPQSPQLFKQILMVGGLDRYFQIATCFRDEDLRSDRQPEFTQIDAEMSFATDKELFPIGEKMINAIFKECLQVDIPRPFRKMTYAECMDLYGTDKPDLRFGLEFIHLEDLAGKTSFTIFKDGLELGWKIKGFRIEGGATYSRKEIDGYNRFIQSLEGKGLVWMKLVDGELLSPIAKYIDEEDKALWKERLALKEGDSAFFIAGEEKKTNQLLDHLRRKVARDRGLIEPNRYEALWVVDFPLFAYNDEERRIESEHHPFTSPHLEDLHFLEDEPLRARASSFDLVLNGYEVASGSQRIHDEALQEKIFSLLGLPIDEIEEKFGFFIEALRYGTPPHLGFAFGFDRIMMILCGTENIRDIIAFPKTQKAQDLMTEAPAEVHKEQLREVHLDVKL